MSIFTFQPTYPVNYISVSFTLTPKSYNVSIHLAKIYLLFLAGSEINKLTTVLRTSLLEPNALVLEPYNIWLLPVPIYQEKQLRAARRIKYQQKREYLIQ